MIRERIEEIAGENDRQITGGGVRKKNEQYRNNRWMRRTPEGQLCRERERMPKRKSWQKGLETARSTPEVAEQKCR